MINTNSIVRKLRHYKFFRRKPRVKVAGKGKAKSKTEAAIYRERRKIHDEEKYSLDTPAKLTRAKLNKRYGDADLSKDKSGPKSPPELWRCGNGGLKSKGTKLIQIFIKAKVTMVSDLLLDESMEFEAIVTQTQTMEFKALSFQEVGVATLSIWEAFGGKAHDLGMIQEET
ncbi:hypothetical protein Tco_0414847 [Tanacetum coccineum]